MRGKIALFLAIALGLVAVWAAKSLIVGKVQQVEDKLRLTKVIAATQRIERGTRITPNMVDKENGVDVSEAQLEDHVLIRYFPDLIGAIAARDIERGQAIRWSYVSRGEEPRLSQQLPAGKVALSLPVDNVSGVAGNVRPGSRVDVISTFTLPQRAGGGGSAADVRSFRMLTQVFVLAVDNRTTLEELAPSAAQARTRPYSSVTLAVTPDEAVILTFARTQGSVVLAIRNPSDPLTAEPAEIHIGNVMDAARRANEARKKELSEAGPLPGGTK